MHREHTKEIRIGSRTIGGGNPIAIQSMTNTRTENVEATVAQILALEEAGCDIIRCTVPTMEAAEALKTIISRVHIPVVADIHFDYRLAIASIENGADKIRINPGNIGGPERIREVVNAARMRNIPIRVGVNSGSLEKELIDKASKGEECEELTERIDALQEEKQKLLMEEAGEKGLHQRMQEIAEFLKGQETGIEEYDETLVRKLIEKITVYDDRCDVEFKSGMIVEVYPPS